jgi:hypothetical protein
VLRFRQFWGGKSNRPLENSNLLGPHKLIDCATFAPNIFFLMKNKHLVFLLLLLAVAVWASRRWSSSRAAQSLTHLIALDLPKIKALEVPATGGGTVWIERGETGWIATHAEQSVAVSDSLVAQVLGRLRGIRIVENNRTQRPDTLGLTLPNAPQVKVVVQDARRNVAFSLGKTVARDGQIGTWFGSEQTGALLATGDLRQLLSVDFQAFTRHIAFAPTLLDSVVLIDIRLRDDTLTLRRDSLAAPTWRLERAAGTGPADSVAQWLRHLRRWATQPQERDLDDTRKQRMWQASFDLRTPTGGHLLLHCYAVPHPLPSDEDDLRSRARAAFRPHLALENAARPDRFFQLPEGEVRDLWPRTWQLKK